jgi:flavin-dependent thymidylate synthase
LKVRLAGYNVEAELLKNPEAEGKGVLTPETISAAYARISRSEKDIDELRRQAREDVEKTRKSNKTIIFNMGHHSVAEHAVFNFDIIGVSRLALEEIEQFRLVSYTEKSQRYVTLEGDYVLPSEIKDNGYQMLFRDTVAIQNEFYKKSFSILKEFIYDKYPQLTDKKSNRSLLDGWAKEDARYILSLATEGQVGMTINARNLEHLFRRFHLSRRTEIKEIGKEMYRQVMPLAPSLILFADPSTFSRELNEAFKTNFGFTGKPGLEVKNPGIVRSTENGDDVILASFLSVYKSMDYNKALEMIEGMEPVKKEEIFKDLFKSMEFFDSPPREFEMVDITFQAIISASNFAQLKRHRMATLLQGEYDTAYGNVIPPNISTTGLEEEFSSIITETNKVYLKLKDNYENAADYILTNSHCRPVLMRMNLREVFHFARLRADEHAQWDIRKLAQSIIEQAKPLMPLSTMLLCGKSDYVSLFEHTYNRKPGFTI